MASDVPEFSLELFQKFRQQAKKPATYEVSDQNGEDASVLFIFL